MALRTIICSNCKYKREIGSDRPVPKRCPYCGKEGTVERVKSAQDILNDVSSDKEFLEE